MASRNKSQKSAKDANRRIAIRYLCGPTDERNGPADNQIRLTSPRNAVAEDGSGSFVENGETFSDSASLPIRERAGIQKLFHYINGEPGKVFLYVSSLSVLSHKLEELCWFLDNLAKSGTHLISVREGLDSRTEAGHAAIRFALSLNELIHHRSYEDVEILAPHSGGSSEFSLSTEQMAAEAAARRRGIGTNRPGHDMMPLWKLAAALPYYSPDEIVDVYEHRLKIG